MDHLIFDLMLRHGGIASRSDYVALKMLSNDYMRLFNKVQADCTTYNDSGKITAHFGLRREIATKRYDELTKIHEIRIYLYGELVNRVSLYFDELASGHKIEFEYVFAGPSHRVVTMGWYLLKSVESLTDIDIDKLGDYLRELDMKIFSSGIKKSVSNFEPDELPYSWNAIFITMITYLAADIAIAKFIK